MEATAVSKYSEKTLDAPLYEDAIILPAKENFEHGFSRYGGVIDKTGVFVSSTSWNFRSNGAYDVDKSQLKTIDKAIFIGNHTSTWGHLLTDSMKKLWFLFTSECKKLLTEGYVIVYVGYGNVPPPSYVCEMFQLAGLDLNEYLQITTPTICHHLVIPDNSLFDGGITKEYN